MTRELDEGLNVLDDQAEAPKPLEAGAAPDPPRCLAPFEHLGQDPDLLTEEVEPATSQRAGVDGTKDEADGGKQPRHQEQQPDTGGTSFQQSDLHVCAPVFPRGLCFKVARFRSPMFEIGFGLGIDQLLTQPRCPG
jgi:hypothetical protein